MSTESVQGQASDTKQDSKSGSKRRRLGKGLSGLIGDPVSVQGSSPSAPTALAQASTATPSSEAARNEPSASPDVPTPDGERVASIAVTAIIPNRFQPRVEFDADSLAELAASIRAEGVMQPVLVRASSGSGSTGGRYELIAGERRWRAAKLAGLERVPAIVRDLGDEKSAEWALIENIHRRDLNAMERAEAMASLLSRFDLSQSALAEKLGMQRSSVANLVRLVELEPEIRALIASDKIGAGHGKALLAMAAGDARVKTAQAAAAGGWSVRRLEAEAKLRAGRDTESGAKPDASIGSQRAAVISSLERRLSDHLGTRVRIHTNPSGTKGRVEIGFYGLDHFEGLVRSLGLDGIG